MRTDQGTAFSRRVSLIEKMIIAHPPEASTCIQIVVEGAGVLDPDAVAEAVTAAARACPGARLVRDGQRFRDSGKPPRVRVLDGDPLDRETFEGLPELQRPLPCAPGEPTSEVVVLTGERPALVFRVAHAVMDGAGVLLWMEQVFRALRGTQPQSIEVTAEELDLESLRPVGRAAVPMASAPPPLRAGALAQYPTFFLRRTIHGNHAGLIAKIAVALTELYDLDPGIFLVSTDLRRHKPDLLTTDNLGGSLRLPVAAGATWQQVHGRLLTLLADNEDLRPLPGPLKSIVQALPVPMLGKLLSTMDGLLANVPAFLLTNLGRLDLAAHSTTEFTATTIYCLPNRLLLSSRELVVVEVAGRTELVISGDDTPELRERARALLDGIEAALSPAGSVLHGPSAPAAEEPDTLVAAFARQVRRSPEAVALVGADGPMTYAELDARSNAVAGELIARGVRPGDVVAVLGERTVATVAGIWGVLKVGAAYLPVDPRNPDTWIRELLADAGARVGLLGNAHVDRDCLPEGCAAVVVDEVSGATAAPEVAINPHDLAYVIYTSGSTGRSKGVELEHRAVLAYCRYAIEAYGIDGDSCFPLFTSLAFDLPVTALLPPLLAGGRVVLIQEEPDHRSLARMLTGYGVNSIKLTPSHLDLISRLGLKTTDMRVAVVGGEGLAVEVAEMARAAFGPQCRIINEYGPAEAAVGCVVHTYDPETDTEAAVPIGRPVDNTTIYLLDELRAGTAPGEAGEIYIAGPQLARGYRGRPELNREMFLTLADGTRAYRTGDLARLLPTGELDYLGRRDDQIKLLGHRVEPAEIERALRQHPVVEQALVVAKARPGSTTKLACAYVVASRPVTREEMTEHVAGLLPAHFVPSMVTQVDSLPQTANGKADLRALPDPFATETDADAGNLDGTEEAVAKIWAHALDISAHHLTSDSDFTALGGTSIGFLSMVAGVCRQLLSPEGEQRFMAELGQITAEPTLGRVAALVQRCEQVGA